MSRSLAWLAGAIVVIVFLSMISPALPRDNGQWEGADAAISKWYRDLRQPDAPHVPCCGEADAYWADSFEVEGDHYVAIITDERDDAPLMRPHIAPGTRIPVPNSKIKWDKGNPTGHGILFVGPGGVYCYLPPMQS